MRHFLNSFERLDSRLLIFLVFACNNLQFPLSGGEEQYLQYAKEWWQPDWIPGSFTLTEFAGTRLPFQIICGFFLQFLPIDWFAMLARAVMFALFAFPLARIFRMLNLSNLFIFAILQIFVITDQSLFGKEWMFRTFEPKVLAYVFLFYGLAAFLEQRYRQWALWMVAATYFHVLVGGWFFGTGLLVILYRNRSIRNLAKLTAVYVLPLLPFIVYLARGILLNTPEAIGGVNLDWVYVYYRLPHHLGIFDSWAFFIKTHLSGVILTALWLVICVLMLRRKQWEPIKTLLLLTVVILSINLVFVAVAAVDATLLNKSGKLGLKYYPFRQSTLAMFFLYLIFAGKIQQHLSLKLWFAHLQKLAFVLVGIIFFSNLISTTKHNYRYFTTNDPFQEMTEVIRAQTKPDDRFILVNMGNFRNSDTYVSFSRHSLRDNFVVYKFIPAGTEKLYEWYQRNMLLAEIEDNITGLVPVAHRYHIDYVLASHPIEQNACKLYFENGIYYLYEIEPQY